MGLCIRRSAEQTRGSLYRHLSHTPFARHASSIQDNKDNEDLDTTAQLMKRIQQDWKKIGHVPRKDSDNMWKEFKDACNHFFDRGHGKRNQASQQEEESLSGSGGEN